MIEIDAGTYVKVFFKNSTQVEGTVEVWSSEESVLLSSDKESKFVILNTSEDVLGVKVSLSVTQEKPIRKIEDVISTFEEVKKEPSEDVLRLKKLSELKMLMNEEEKKIVAAKLNEHTISEVRTVTYGLPNFKKQSTK